jgi:RNA polymerase sigma factor (sigma-70 family)
MARSTFQQGLSRIGHGTGGAQTADQELLARFLAGREEGAFAALMERHGPMVLGVCERVLRNGHDAEDACQAVFLVLARKAGSVRKHGSLASWLHGVALRVAHKLHARLARRAAREAAAAARKPTACEPDEISWREVQRLLDEELQALPDRYRAPLVLCYLQGRTRDEAARELGWTLGALHGRLERGREMLRGRLVRRGVIGASAVALAALVPGLSSAALPPALVTSTAQASVALAAGQPLAATVPASVAALTRDVLRAALWNRLIVAALVGLGGLGLAAVPWAMIHLAPPETQAAQAWPVTRRFEVPQAHAWCVAFSPDGKRLAAGLRGPTLDVGGLRLWDVQTGELLYALETRNSVRCIAFAPDGKTLATAEHDGMARLRDAADGQVRFLLRCQQWQIDSVAFSADGKLLATSGWDRTIKLWDTATGEEVRTLKGHQAQVFTVAFGPGDLLASGGVDGTARIWDSATGKLRHTLCGHTDVVHWLAFAPDGKTLATVSWDQTAKLWDTADGKLLATLQGHTQPALAVAFAPDGRTLVTTAGHHEAETGPGEMILWDLTARKARARLDLDERAYGAAFSPDGTTVATACWDGVVTLRDIPRGGAEAAPPEGLQYVPAVDQAEEEPPAREYAEDYHPALANEGKAVAGLRLFGPDVEQCVRFEPAGLRCVLPAGYPGERPATGVATDFGVRGDFEVTARYEILQEPRAPGWGNPTRLLLAVVPGERPVADVWCQANQNRAELARHLPGPNQVGQFVADLTRWNPVLPRDPWGNQIFDRIEVHHKQLGPAAAGAGRLRLVRRGATLFFYTSEEPGETFTLLSRGGFGTKDLKDVRLLAATGGPAASLDVRVTDLRLRADGFVRGGQPFPLPAASASPVGVRLVLPALGVPLLAGAFALAAWLSSRRRRVVEAPVAAALAFACPGCGKRLRARGVPVGSRLKCPGCGQAFEIPAGAEELR